MSWSSVFLVFLKAVCSSVVMLLVFRCHMGLLLTIIMLKGLAETVEQADGCVSGIFLGVLFHLHNRGDDGFFPCYRKDS